MNKFSTPIAFFCPSLRVGGAEKVVVNLVKGFTGRGVPVHLLLANADGELLGDLPQTVNVIDFHVNSVIKSLPHFIKYLRNENPTILLSVQMHANLTALLAKIIARVSTKVIVSEHSTISLNSSASSGIKEALLPLMARALYPRADSIVAVSQGVADDLSRALHLSNKNINVIYNPVIIPELAEKAHKDPVHSWFEPGSPPVVLAVGRLTAAKDYPTLIRAFYRARQVQDIHLIVLGEGEQRACLEKLIRQLNLADNVQLRGYEPNPYAYMARAAVFVLSSAWEGFPNVVVEALACGVPVVATNCKSGPAEILDHGRFGMLVPVGNVDALAAAILSALNVTHNRELLKIRAQQFSLDDVLEKYTKLFDAVIST